MNKSIFRMTYLFLSAILLTSLLLSGLAFGNVLNARAEGGTVEPPPPGEGEGAPDDNRIVGGALADPGEWPWQVALVGGTSSDLYNGQFCGGSLIGTQWVVTAAHCVYGDSPSAVDVVAGIYNLSSPTPGYQRRDVSNIYVHPNYNPNTSDSDIALLRLASAVTLGGTGATATAVIPLVPSSVGALTGVNSWVTGWGNISSIGTQYPSQLYEVQVPIISNTICDDSNHYAGSITSNMLCAGVDPAGGKDSCQGDSGGPLVISNGGEWQLAGVVSWGDGCAEPYRPGVYTRVSNFTNWVNTTIQTATSTSVTFRSAGGYDGFILESGETTDLGGAMNSRGSTFFLGDNAADRQYRGILSFDTSKLPDNAVITSVTLKLRHAGVSGTNPFNTHGPLLVDIRTGSFNNTSLEAADFSAAATADGVMTISNTLAQNWYTSLLDSGSYGLINLTGVTQFRLRFTLDDNDDLGVDILKIYSGNGLTSYRPQLIVTYTIP